MERIRDSDLALDLGVGQRGHDGAGLNVGAAGCHVPGGHADPELEPGDDGRAVPKCERRSGLHCLVEEFVPGKCGKTAHTDEVERYVSKVC